MGAIRAGTAELCGLLSIPLRWHFFLDGASSVVSVDQRERLGI
jgi:hypothetical protein